MEASSHVSAAHVAVGNEPYCGNNNTSSFLDLGMGSGLTHSPGLPGT